MPLFWKLFIVNTVVVVGGAALIAFTPLTVDFPPTNEQVGYLALGALTLLLLYAALIGISLQPLAELREDVENVIGLDDDARLIVHGNDEVAQLAAAYNGMLTRLERERTAAARAAVTATEAERARIARELHDDVGQTLTFLLLRLSVLDREVPARLRPDVAAITAAARNGLDEVRTISRRLRPAVLSELGIGPALRGLGARIEGAGEIRCTVQVSGTFTPHGERDLALYRIAQEALTNVLRHASARSVTVSLTQKPGRARLIVSDDGLGTTGELGVGSYSMRERARLLGGTFERVSEPGRGTTVTVEIPLEPAGAPLPPDASTRPIPVPPDVSGGVLGALVPAGSAFSSTSPLPGDEFDAEEENAGTEQGGEEADDEVLAHRVHPEQAEDPAAEQAADDADDDVEEDTLLSVRPHDLAGDPARETADDDPTDDAHVRLLDDSR